MTENHDYAVPTQGTVDWHVPLNDNFAALDRDVPVWDSEANRDDYAPVDGSHFVATDTGVVYEGDGSTWTEIGTIGSSGPTLYSQASAPSNPAPDDVWFDQRTGVLQYYDGSDWVAPSSGSDGSSGSDRVTSDVHVSMDGTNVMDADAFGSPYTVVERNASMAAGESYAGSRSLEHAFDEGTHRGSRTFYDLPENGWGQPDEVHTRVHVKFEDGWRQADSSTTCKIYWGGANFYAGDGGWGGNAMTGDNGFSVRVFSRGPADDGTVTLASYVYHLDQNGTYGDEWDWPDPAPIGEWNRIDTYVKLNSASNGSANRDGVVRLWLNGSLQDEHTDLRWRTTEDMGVAQIGPGTYWGGSETVGRDNRIYFDELRASFGQEGLS